MVIQGPFNQIQGFSEDDSLSSLSLLIKDESFTALMLMTLADLRTLVLLLFTQFSLVYVTQQALVSLEPTVTLVMKN